MRYAGYFLLIAITFLFGCGLVGKTPPIGDKYEYQDDVFQPGQKWAYPTRDGEPDSYLVVLKTERYGDTAEVVHISVEEVYVTKPDEYGAIATRVPHLPYAKAALKQHVDSLIGTGAEVIDFRDAYYNWQRAYKKGQAGLWTTSLDSTLEMTEDMLAKRTGKAK